MNTKEHVKIPDIGLLRVYGLMRIVFAYIMFHTITFGHSLFAPLYYPQSFWSPVSLAFLMGGPPEVWLIQWVSLLAIVFTLMLGFGIFTRYSGPFCFVMTCLATCISFAYGRLNHNNNTVFLLLLVFSFSNWGYCYSIDSLWSRWRKREPSLTVTAADPQWPITWVLAVFSLPYLTTAVLKVIKGHFLEPGYISAVIKYKQIFWEQHGTIPEVVRQLQNFLIANTWITNPLTYVTLGIETFFFLSVLSKRLRIICLALALSLHASITITTKVYFLEHMYILALLLTASLVLYFREKNTLLAQWFPQRSPDTDPVQAEKNSSALWLGILGAYGVSLLFIMVLPTLHLPQIQMNAWLWLRKLHEEYPLFATNSYLFDYVSDIVVGAVCWVFSALVLAYFLWAYVRHAAKVVFSPPVATPGRTYTLIYDGDCGFCQKWCDWSIRQGANKIVQFQPWQTMDPVLAEQVNLPMDSYSQYAVLVESLDGQIVRIAKGAGAINGVLKLLPGPLNMGFRFAGTLYDVDGLSHLEDFVYSWVAHNRQHLSAAGCKLTPSA
jgi:predicted DCC family thiol-disulfide oxidoreductase YuxK